MLKLKRVEIQGFKSFFDKTEMRFNGSGIAAVVGPNGCGKSNLSDAISWVLGEQSAKSLRGTRMEDVIFAGTRERKPLGMASVTMTLADPSAANITHEHTNGNANGHLQPHESGRPGDITITRRLFRSGESEYLINGRPARLRDIQDLFMGTGLGPESYAIIEQGRIGQILSNKPHDRRAVIEEAAGITKFKTKKRLAEAKLEGAKQNLARVFDILEEAGRQANSLKRQAAKTKRYEELRAELLGELRRALTARFRVLERDAAKTALELSAANTEFQNLSREVAEKERENSNLQEQSYTLERRLTDARKELHEFRLEHERTRSKLDYQARQVSVIEQRLEQGARETHELSQGEQQFQTDLDLHIHAFAQLEAEAASARQALALKTKEREAVQGLLQDRTRTLEAGRQHVLKLLGEASSLRNQLAQIEQILAGIERDTARSRRDEESAISDLNRLVSVKATLTEQMSARQLQLETVAEQRKAVEQELSVRKSKLGDARRSLEQLRTDLSRLKARHDSLQEILLHRSYTTETVKRLFTAVERGAAPEFRPMGVLADFVEVEPGYEKATEEFLHEELEYVVVRNWSDADRGIDLIRRDADGRATFLVHPEPADTNDADNALLQEPSVYGRLSDFLRFTNGLSSAPSNLIPRLARCYLVEDRTSAQLLARQYPDAYLLAPDGVSYHDHSVSGGKKTGAGPLALKREVRDLKTQVQSKQKGVDETTSAIDTLDREIAVHSEELEQLRALQQREEKETLALDHEFRKVGEEHSRASSRLSVARIELERLEREGRRFTEEREKALRLLEEKEAARSVQEQVLEQSMADFEEMQADAHRLTEEHSSLRAALAALEERARSERTAQARLETQVRELSKRQQDLAQELDRLRLERTALLEDNGELGLLLSQLSDSIGKLEGAVAELSAEETGMRERLLALEEVLRSLRQEVSSAQDRRSHAELELVKRQAELKYLDETSRRELNAPVEELARDEETVLDEAQLAQVEARCQELRSKIDALGPVNPAALEEYRQAQQRQDFLQAQRQDLLDSIRDTERAIQEIDAESRKRFAEAFEVINANFREMFKTLFGGGTGEMRLTDEANAAESGIDIVASPPGKRLQNVLLLSGGEKSLTAMALLMAIFQYQPSPFCVLDEVDAPLDEANIERLTRLLKEMADQTQFIVITHAKRTMEAAQSLYGVTMQEPGISKLVSVRFQPVGPGAAVPPALGTAGQVPLGK